MIPRILGAPQRYVQGPGAIERLGAEIETAGGGPVAVIIDPVAREILGETIARQLPEARILRFGGECAADEISALAEQAKEARLIVGVGGGKTIDTAKGVAVKRDRPVGIVPTIASNDSPTSHIAVIYSADHAVEGVWHMRANPFFVLVDTAVIAGAPRRFLAAGIGDAMSKPYELAGALAGGGLNFFGGAPTELTRAIVARAQEILLRDGPAAMAAASPDEPFERVVEATILLSGLAFESGGLSIAHAMVRGLSKRPELAHLLHGELVVLGTLTQIAAGQGDAGELDRLCVFYRGIGLPTDFKRFGLVEDGALREIAEATLAAPYARNYARALGTNDLIVAMRALNERAGG